MAATTATQAALVDELEEAVEKTEVSTQEAEEALLRVYKNRTA